MMMRFRLHPVLLALCFIFSFSGYVQSQGKVDVARSEWMKGYVKLENADKAYKEGNKLAALQLYREALVVFEAVRRQYPQWNPSLLNFRIKYCHQKITELDQSVQQEAEGMSRENLLELTAKQAQMLHDNSLKIQQLNTSVSILTESLQRARTEAAKNAAAESDFSNLQTARKELDDRCRLLQSKLSKAEEDIAELRKQAGDKIATQKLQEENRQQSRQLQESARQIETLQENLKNIRAELEKTKQDNERQNRAAQDYKKRLQAATDRVAELTGMLNELHVQYNALKLKSQQQDVDINFQKESNARLSSEKKELQDEVQLLRNIRDKFAVAQDTSQTLRAQVLDYENRLQETLEKSRFEAQKRDEQSAQLQATLNAVRKERQDAMDALMTAKAEQLAARERHQQELTAKTAEVEQLRQALLQEQKAHQDLAAKTAEVEQLRQALQQEQKARQELTAAKAAEKPAEIQGTSADATAALELVRQDLASQIEQVHNLKEELAGVRRRTAEVLQEKERLSEALRVAEKSRQDLQKTLVEKSGSPSLPQEYAVLQNSHAQLKTRVEELQAQLKTRDEGLQAQLKTRNEELQAQLKNAQGELQEAGQNLKRSQDYGLTLEKQLQQLREAQKEFSNISKQLQNKDELLSSRDETLRQQAERLATANALVLTKTDEAQSARVELQGLKRKLADMEVLNGRLNEQLTGVIRRQADFDRDNADLKARLLEEEKRLGDLQRQQEKNTQELTAKTALSIRLEKSLAEAEGQREELGRQLAAEQQKNKLLEQDAGSSRTKVAAVDGLTSNMIDLQNQLKLRSREIEQLKNDLQKGQTQVSVLTEQLKRRDEQVREMMAAKESQTERIWLNRLADLNSKLEQEENRRKALEIALIQKEAESRKPASPTPAEAPAKKPADDSQASIRRNYSEKEILLNGFLRQALDAEKQQKTEAALWNYQKVLELEPDHLLALKRLGLIAANNGNDADTVKYLKLAFRYNPDDPEVLLALGFAMINLQQPEWAFSYLGRAVALEPANATLSRLFGGALVDLGWTQAAESQFVKALELNPKDAHSAFNLAVLCATANPPRLEEAKKWYQQAVRNGAEKDPRFEAEFK